MPEKITIVKDGGESVNSNIVSVFLIPDLNKKYIITTENAVDPHGLTVLHVSEIQGDTLAKVATDEEWSTIKTIMRAIISGSVGNYQYIPSFETINAAGAYSRDISVSAPASKQMIDGYATGEKIEPVEEKEEEVLDVVDADSIFPTAPVETSDNEVVPGIALDDAPVTIENTPEQPEVDPSVQGAQPLDPATLPVKEPVPVAPVQAEVAPQQPTPVIQSVPEAPAPAPEANAPTPVVQEAPVQAPVATPVPEAPAAPAAPAPEVVQGAELVPQATPVVEPTTVVPEVVDATPTPDSIVEEVPAVAPAPEAVLDKVDEVTAAINNVTETQEQLAVPATPNGAAVAVPADPNAAVEPIITDTTVVDTTAQPTDSVVDVLTPVPDDAVVTTPDPIIVDAPAVPEVPAVEAVPEVPQVEEVPVAEPAPVEEPAPVAEETPAEAPAEPVPEAVPEIPVVGTVGQVQNIQQMPQQPVVVQQNTMMPQTSAMKNLGITLDFGSQPNMDTNSTLDEIVAGAQELFVEGVKNLVLVMTEKLYKDLKEREDELKKREVVLAQRERAINDSTLAMMNGDFNAQPMMNPQMMNPQMMNPQMMNSQMMQQPMMGQQMMGQPMMQQPMMGQPMMNPQMMGQVQQVPPQDNQASGQV